MVLLISYDLNGNERPSSYTDVKKAIEGKATSFRRPLYSQWLIETNSSVNEWQRRLKTVIDNNDKLFICQVFQPTDGWLDKADWEWLNARIDTPR